ncbi:9025_t:CDS:10 [Diversispora eburnea]|uniref:9025_t:CDS:1 n=1 Tax=Diversispora eburnea TaxID=1213867 RepID=A0A9N8V6U6_9GLOM|nr:9025_t:CDS:10 [Diversispora eburnea]
MDSLHLKPPTYVRKRNGSLDSNLFSNSYWFNQEKFERSSRSHDDTFVIALIGKPSVGKSTILRTGLKNLSPITNVGVERNILFAPTLITEIEVDDKLYPVEVLEILENVFDMKSELRWPRDLPGIDGVMICYDVTNRASIANIAWLLNAFRDFHVPSILVACKADCDPSKHQVDTQYGPKLGDLFNVGFVELDTRTEQGIHKIHDVFSMLLRLSIRQREFTRKDEIQKLKSNISNASTDSVYMQSISSDADSEKHVLSHRRSSSDQSHENRGRNRLSNLSAVKFMSSRYTSRFGTSKSKQKSHSPLSKRINKDEESLPACSHPCPIESNAAPSFAITPPQTPPTNSILSQSSLSSTSTSSCLHKPSERNSHRRSFLPSSTLLQVMETEEENAPTRDYNRISFSSYDSTISSASSTWDGFGEVNELTSERELNKCAGNKDDGMTVDELIQRLTKGGQYGKLDDPFMITFFTIYRIFMRPRDVLIKLMHRFRECERDMDDRRNTTHEKICNLLYHWITQHPHDLIHPQTRKLMFQFLDIIKNSSHLAYYANILTPLINGTVPNEDLDALWGYKDLDDEELNESEFDIHQQKVTDIISASRNPKKDSGIGSWVFVVSNGLEGRPMNQMTFDELPEKSISNELTYQEFQLFKTITGRDLLRHIWTPQNNDLRVKGRVAKVITMILSQEKLKARVAMMKKFMKIAIIARESNNFNTLMAIIAAVNSAPILRLRQTRELLKCKSSFKKFSNLENLMSSNKSFGNYRFAGVHLQDLLSIGEGNRNFQKDGRIHWNKFSLMGDVINMICRHQKSNYNIKGNNLIGKFINDTEVMNEDESYNKSLELEPRIQRAASTSRVRRH